MTAIPFAPRNSIEDVEEGTSFAPRFDADGHIPVVTTDAQSGEVLMMGVMTAQALRLTIETGEAHCRSRARQYLWRKGATSGLVQRVVEMRVDDDQDAVWLRVDVAVGAGPLQFTESAKMFDPVAVYGDAPNPTQL